MTVDIIAADPKAPAVPETVMGVADKLRASARSIEQPGLMFVTENVQATLNQVATHLTLGCYGEALKSLDELKSWVALHRDTTHPDGHPDRLKGTVAWALAEVTNLVDQLFGPVEEKERDAV